MKKRINSRAKLAYPLPFTIIFALTLLCVVASAQQKQSKIWLFVHKRVTLFHKKDDLFSQKA